ncbi:MAG: helix-turn-helix domain-containing protein [Actinophytocola sp.]|uniref:helix-turn-helix domain-containing protein n=1 Tax=Actinophytocola sp. TaxID=1872138 RepID=UPI00132C37CC|nr:helix-turn-helix transcriptional regulator [Actinophytocola sp.]MPZ79472.1 helix-turn-helix domain-containing protein [Actinophytocola sp.]
MTHANPGPVVQRILLGAQLSAAREARGMSTTDATKALGWYAGKLSKIEAGDVPTNDKDLAKAVRVFEIPPEQAGPLQRLAAEARRKLPPSRVPEWAAKYVHLVAAATELKLWNGDTFPGTVQTADYARATLAHAVTVSAADVDRMAEERVRRVDRLKAPNAPRLWLVVGEEALHREIGGPETLRGQLERVRELVELPNVNVQVIPFDGGAHSSHGVSFSIVNLIEGRQGIVYVGGLTGSDYLGREHVRVYNLAFDNLRAAALSQQRTMDMINRRITEL